MGITGCTAKEAQIIDSKRDIAAQADVLVGLAGIIGLHFRQRLGIGFDQVSQFPDDPGAFARPDWTRLSPVGSTVNIHEAKTHLSRLVARAAAGEEIVIARAGHPLARLVAYEQHRQPREPGRLKGRIWVADDFDQTPEWLIDAFES